MADDGQTEIRVFLTPEVERLLIENETDVVTLLRRSGADVSAVPGPPSGGGEKEPVTILLATAALVATLTPLLTRALSALSRKAVLVSESVPVAVTDASGNVVHDEHGKPVIEYVERHRFVETQPQAEPDQKAEVNALGWHVSLESRQRGTSP